MAKLVRMVGAVALPILAGCSGETDVADGNDVGNTTPRVQLPQPVNSVARPSQIVCDEFTLVTEVDGESLDLAVETDLPDNAVLMVSVSRSYLEVGSSDTYSVDYFSQKSTVGEWRSAHTISIASDTWENALRAKQEEMSRIGLGFEVASISDTITARMVVPINQPDPAFGKENKNLSGKAVRSSGLRVVEDEIEIPFPLDSSPSANSQTISLDPRNLDTGQSYVVSGRTPLMPSINPSDPGEAIQDVEEIPARGRFKVFDVETKDGIPWYKVTAFDEDNQRIGAGWINSTALLGQQLEARE
jgi:hypothetical protein